MTRSEDTTTVPPYAPTGEKWLRPAGSTGLTVSALGLGGAPLSSMPEVLGYEVPKDRAVLLVEAVLASPVTVIDTSNNYNDGESERRIGRSAAQRRQPELGARRHEGRCAREGLLR